ncbi:hypothetical protein ES705_29029 [subsurface metagenome]
MLISLADLSDDEKENWLSNATFLINEDLDEASEFSKKTLAGLNPFLYRTMLLNSAKKRLSGKRYYALVEKIMNKCIVHREDLDFVVGKEILKFEIRNT